MTDQAPLVAQMVKNLPAMQETWVQILGWEDPLEEGMETHSSTLIWRIPLTNLERSSPWGGKELDTTDWLTHTHMHTHTELDRGDWRATVYGVAESDVTEVTQHAQRTLPQVDKNACFWIESTRSAGSNPALLCISFSDFAQALYHSLSSFLLQNWEKFIIIIIDFPPFLYKCAMTLNNQRAQTPYIVLSRMLKPGDFILHCLQCEKKLELWVRAEGDGICRRFSPAQWKCQTRLASYLAEPAPSTSCLTVSHCALFAEPRVGKAGAGKPEEDTRSRRNCRRVYSLLADAAAITSCNVALMRT